MAGLWLKLDCDYWDHPKIVQAGVMAGVLYQRMSMYCMAHTTDGLVPAGQVPRFAMPATTKLVAALVAAGLIERADGGWLLPGYVERYPSAAELERRRRTSAENGRKGGRPRNPEKTQGVSGQVPAGLCDTKPSGKQDVDVDVDVDVEGLASSDTSAARPPASAPAGPAESIIGTLGIVGAVPTAGEHALVARCLARGWTVGLLQAKAERALDADRPRQWLVKALEGCANEDPPAAPANGAPAATAGHLDTWSAQWTLCVTRGPSGANDAAKRAWHDTRQTRRYDTEVNAKFAFRDAYLLATATPAEATA